MKARITINTFELSAVQVLTLYCAMQSLHEELSARLELPRRRERSAQEQLEDRNALGVLDELRVLFTSDPARPPEQRAEAWAAVLDGLAVLAAAETIGVAMRDRPRELVALHAEQRTKLLAALRCLLGEVAP